MDLELQNKIEKILNDYTVTSVVKDVDEQRCILPMFIPKIISEIIKIVCEYKATPDELPAGNCNKPLVINLRELLLALYDFMQPIESKSYWTEQVDEFLSKQ